MVTRGALMESLREVNVLIAASNKQLEAYRLLHDSAALIDDGKSCDVYRQYMHAILDTSLDQTAQQQRVLRLIGKLND
jgi:hypothetical protein